MGRALGALAAGIATLMWSGCPSPGIDRCQIQCTAAGPCPGDMVCGADLFCHDPGDEAVCSSDPGDADAAPACTDGESCPAGGVCFEGVCGGADVVQVDQACAVTQSGSVWCWGWNASGRAGIDPAMSDLCPDDQTCVFAPRRVESLPASKQISVGRERVACAITMEDEVWCWGANNRGQLGHVSAGDSSCSIGPCNWQPQKVDGLSDVTDIAAGEFNVCAVAGGTVYCWGAGSSGVTGQIDNPDAFAPVELATGYLQVTVGSAPDLEYSSFACARTTSDEVHCWGGNSNGQLGHDPATDGSCGATGKCKATPMAVVLEGVPLMAQDLDAGEAPAVCAIAGDSVYCWGYGEYGQLGPTQDGFPTVHTPVQIPDTPDPSQVSVGASSACMRGAGDEVFCWGVNTFGQLGNGTTDGTECGGGCEGTPQAVSGLHRFTDIAVGVDSAFGVTADGEVFAWGLNSRAALGHEPDTGDDTVCGVDKVCIMVPTRIDALAAPL